MASIAERFSRWSWSHLQVYRKCHFRARLKYLERSPEPERKEDDARDRGTKIHKAMEDFVNMDTRIELPPVLQPFEGPLQSMRDMKQDGVAKVEIEQPMYFDQNWNILPEDGPERWLIVIPDANVTVPREFCLTIDGKSGKKFGNEVSHFGQLELYSIAQWVRDPSYSEYESELWYFDQKDIVSHVFTPPQLERARARLDREVELMMKDTIHRPNPSKMNCKYCPYSPRGTGACPVGV